MLQVPELDPRQLSELLEDEKSSVVIVDIRNKEEQQVRVSRWTYFQIFSNLKMTTDFSQRLIEPNKVTPDNG